MCKITTNDLFDVYEQLKDRYNLILTTTSALNAEFDAEFTIDCPIIIGKAHEQIVQLYVYENIFILDVMDDARTKGTHWHPFDVKSAVYDIAEFMNGKTDYGMDPFRQI